MLHRLPPAIRQVGPSRCQAGPFRVTSTSSSADKEPSLRTERLWQAYLTDPSQWWDNRKDKANPKDPDFRNKVTKEALWIDGGYSPGWAKKMFEKKEVEEREGQGIKAGKPSGWHAKQEQVDVSKLQPPREGSGWEMLSLEEVFSILDRRAELPSVENFICILQKCRKKRNLEYAKRLHVHICNNGLEAHRTVGNYIVPMFVECGSVSDAQQVFNRLVHRTEHSWTSLILGYIQCGQSQHALNLYRKMQEDNVHPSRYTLMALLKACARLKDVERGRETHVEIAQMGLDTDLFVGNTLIDMYAKCGSLSEARKVFDKLPVRDVVVWTALIAGYAEHGYGKQALKCFEQMQLEGISPDVITFVCVLKTCGSIGAISKGREIHAQIAQKGFARDLFVGSALVDMYAKCGSLSEAWEVFDKMPVRDVVVWTTLIAGYTEHGPVEKALKCFEQMQVESISPDAVTFIYVLKACGSIGVIDKGREIHSEIIQKGFDNDLFVGNTLVDMYVKCGSISQAREVFDKLPVRDVVSWNALIAGYAENGPGEEALRCFEQMQLEGVSPTAVTFVCALKGCGSIGAIDKGREIHAEAGQKGFEKDPFVGNTLVDMYAKCGSLSDAQKVFEMLPVRDVLSWNALIAGYAEHGPAHEVLKCFEQMQLKGVSPNAITFVCCLKACSRIRDINKGREIHDEIVRKGFEGDPLVGNTLVDMYAKCGSVVEAEGVFDTLPVRNVVSWTALIAGYTEFGPGQKALECFEQMQLEGVTPNVVTFVCSLKACGSIGALDKGREIHAEIVRNGFEGEIFVGNTLVDMYAKCGSLSEAREVFDKLPVRDVVSWSAMINGYGMNHEGNMAVQCFEEMQEQGVKPNAITFTCLLTACSHASLVFKGQEYFKMMKEECGIVPTIDHYTCMVDLLARSGHLYDAEKFLEAMPCPPSIGTWTALLSACKMYGEAEMGLRCFQQLVQLSPEYSASYVHMANIYASAGRRDDAYRIEERRKHAGAKKKPASALIEVNKKVHEFVLGSSQSKEISAMLEFLSLRMKEKGHVPNLDLDLRRVSDEDKEIALCEHAEKLALAFGLLHTPEGQTLRVTKNLRMCNNCHNANKTISRIAMREIIVRDGYCVHHFRDGLCSCRDVL